jgi:hypothetical protein
MGVEIRWKSSLSATCLHAAACHRAGVAAADPRLAAALDGPAAALVTEMEKARWPVDDLLGQMAGLAGEFENNRELTTRALARLPRFKTNETAVNRVAGAIADLEAALRRFQPEIVEELAVRGGPIREQWEARGPGLLVEMARVTDAAVVPEFAEIVLVSPYAGGAGTAHAAQNRVTLEAVLVNPLPQLPETVRIGWLLCQLNSDLPRFADLLGTARGGAAFRLAMLAPALAAGAEVELTQCDEAGIDAALDAWRLRDGLPEDAAGRIWQWWQAWLDAADTWAVAVAALDGMLRG